MKAKRFLFPWEKTYVMTCAECGRKIETFPLWFWERKEDRIREIQPFSCHTIGPDMISQIPTLTENDWDAGQRWTEYIKEFTDENDLLKPSETDKASGTVVKTPPQALLKYGIFPLMQLFTEKELQLIHLLLCLDWERALVPRFFVTAMKLSRTSVSNVFQKPIKWRMLNCYQSRDMQIEGRARGRQRAYALNFQVRAKLEKDFSDFDFFRNDVKATFRPIGLCYPGLKWTPSARQFLRPEN